MDVGLGLAALDAVVEGELGPVLAPELRHGPPVHEPPLEDWASTGDGAKNTHPIKATTANAYRA